MNWIRALFVEGEGNPSIGSVCVVVVILCWGFDYVWSAVKAQPLRLTAADLAWLVATLYAIKKVVPAIQAWAGRGQGVAPPAQ